MKKAFIPGILVLASFCAAAQQQPLVVIHKNYTDSLSTHKNSLAMSSVEELYTVSTGLEAIDPRATLLTTTSLGKVYSMQPDNMRVLAPNMAMLEKMPGSSPVYIPAPPSKMPNPLYRPRRKNWQ